MQRKPETEEGIDATRRTRLASERTELAWWRTGLTALAVALAVGRVVPSLGGNGLQRWPYAVAGVGFALYGIAVIAYGSVRRAGVERALAQGHFPAPPRFGHGALLTGGLALGLFTVVLVLLD